jgi:hypothetical protein
MMMCNDNTRMATQSKEKQTLNMFPGWGVCKVYSILLATIQYNILREMSVKICPGEQTVYLDGVESFS